MRTSYLVVVVFPNSSVGGMYGACLRVVLYHYIARSQMRDPAELKHISKRREEKPTRMPLVMANEEGRALT